MSYLLSTVLIVFSSCKELYCKPSAQLSKEEKDSTVMGL